MQLPIIPYARAENLVHIRRFISSNFSLDILVGIVHSPYWLVNWQLLTFSLHTMAPLASIERYQLKLVGMLRSRAWNVNANTHQNKVIRPTDRQRISMDQPNYFLLELYWLYQFEETEGGCCPLPDTLLPLHSFTPRSCVTPSESRIITYQFNMRSGRLTSCLARGVHMASTWDRKGKLISFIWVWSQFLFLLSSRWPGRVHCNYILVISPFKYTPQSWVVHRAKWAGYQIISGWMKSV